MKIIGYSIHAKDPAACSLFVGCEVSTDPAWRGYEIASLPAGCIVDDGQHLYQARGGELVEMTAENAVEYTAEVDL